MVEVDINKIKNVISGYSEIIKQLEEDNNVLINEFNEMQKYWNDQNRIKLSTSFNLEKKRILNLEQNIKDQLKVYRYIEENYAKIGKKVKCNLDNQKLLINKLDNVIDKVKSIIDDYDNLGSISFYSRAYLIRNQEYELQKILDSLEVLKSELNNKFSQINNIEKQLSGVLPNMKVEYFVANNYESEV